MYFAEGGGVRSVPVTGGSVTTLAATQDRPRAVAVAEGTAYWLDSETIRAVPVAGGPSRLVRDGLQSPVGLDAAGSDIVWTESYCCPVSGRVLATTPSGGTARVVADLLDAPGAIVLNGDDVYWTEGLPIAQAAVGAGRVMRTSMLGATPATVASGVSTATFTPFAIDQANIYLGDGFTVKRVPIQGGQAELMFRDLGGPLGIVDVASNGRHVLPARVRSRPARR